MKGNGSGKDPWNVIVKRYDFIVQSVVIGGVLSKGVSVNTLVKEICVSTV